MTTPMITPPRTAVHKVVATLKLLVTAAATVHRLHRNPKALASFLN